MTYAIIALSSWWGPSALSAARRMRGSLNARYERAGWQEPFEEDGERNPDRSQV